MPQDPIKGDVLDRVNHRLPKRLGPSSITRILGRVSAIGKGRFDRLDNDVGAVIARRAVGAKIGSPVGRIVLLVEGFRARR